MRAGRTTRSGDLRLPLHCEQHLEHRPWDLKEVLEAEGLCVGAGLRESGECLVGVGFIGVRLRPLDLGFNLAALQQQHSGQQVEHEMEDEALLARPVEDAVDVRRLWIDLRGSDELLAGFFV